MPWVGGVLEQNAWPDNPKWRSQFVQSIRALLERHPRLAGIHVNIEPCPSGNPSYLVLLEEIRRELPRGKLLSVAAYPPTMLLQPTLDVHWEEPYFRQVAARSDQIAMMMYDTGLLSEKMYQSLMQSWTREVIDWAGTTPVLLGIPAYDDAGVGYHHPRVENIFNALLGIHGALGAFAAQPAHYQGVALYSEWEMNEPKWTQLREEFLSSP